MNNSSLSGLSARETRAEFTFGTAFNSPVRQVSLDGAFPQDPHLDDEGGALNLPPVLPELDAPILEVK